MTFKTLHEAGYTDLVSVLPPGAPLSPHSAVESASCGKAPGVRGTDGLWSGYNWRKHAPSAADIARWDASGANIGLKAGRFPAVDIDILDERLAERVEKVVCAALGGGPVRIGRHPKRLVAYRTDTPFPKVRLDFKDPAGNAHAIEVLGEGQQYVVAGKHPTTMKPYEWDVDLETIGAKNLTAVTAEQVDAMLARVKDVLLAFGCTITAQTASAIRDREGVDQTALAAEDIDDVERAVLLVPNDNANFPTREDYLRFGYAIKAACAEDEARGEDIWLEWALRWEGNDKHPGNTEETARSDWARMRPPFAVGASYIFEVARRFGFNDAALEFESEDEPVGEAPAAGNASSMPVQFSDGSLARRLVGTRRGLFRHIQEREQWVAWNGHRWVVGDSAQVRRWASEVCFLAANEALETIRQPAKAESIATRLCSNGTKNAIVSYAADDAEVACSVTDFDKDGWLLNTPSGVIDLRTADVRPARPADMLSKATRIAPDFDMPHPIWDRFLLAVTGGDRDLVDYLQRWAGYMLTGETSEHMLGFMHGAGGNGKGTFLNTIHKVMGDYAAVAAMEAFTASRNERHPTDLAALAGARLVTAQETQDGRRWDEAKVKAITGGDPITARFMHENFFTYQPQFKLAIAGNHRPEIRNLDAAIRRRFHLIPFTVKFSNPDKTLAQRLEAEWPAILAWMVRGCIEWQKTGLNPPKAVIDATEDYFIDEDPVGRWLKENTDEGTEASCALRDLFEDWRRWCAVSGEYAGTEKRFAMNMKARGYEKTLDPKTRRSLLCGVTLRGASEFDSEVAP